MSAPFIEGTLILYQPLYAGYYEEHQFDTDIFESQNGTEVRDSRFNTSLARRVVGARYKTAYFEELILLQNSILLGTIASVGIPLWYSMVFLAQDSGGTTSVFPASMILPEYNVDDYVFLQNGAGDFLVRQIVSIEVDHLVLDDVVTGYVTGDIICPFIVCTPESNTRFSASSERVADYTIVFSEMGEGNVWEGATASASEFYLTFPVFDLPAYELLDVSLFNDFEILGQLWQAQEKKVNKLQNTAFNLKTISTGQFQRKATLDFFQYNKGRLSTFWLKSHKTDLKVKVGALTGANSFTIHSNKDLDYLDTVTRHIWIKRLDQFAKLTSIAPGGDDTEAVVTISPVLVDDLLAGDFIEFLYYGRFDDDKLRFSSSTIQSAGLSDTEIIFKELQRETP